MKIGPLTIRLAGGRIVLALDHGEHDQKSHGNRGGGEKSKEKVIGRTDIKGFVSAVKLKDGTIYARAKTNWKTQTHYDVMRDLLDSGHTTDEIVAYGRFNVKEGFLQNPSAWDNFYAVTKDQARSDHARDVIKKFEMERDTGFSLHHTPGGHEHDQKTHGRGGDGGGEKGESTVRVTESHKDAASHYQDRGHTTLNATLRKKGGRLPDSSREVVKHLDELVEMAEVEQEMILYRGMNARPFEKVEPGSVITDRGFISTSADEKMAAGFALGKEHGAVVHIRVSAGKRALRLGKVTGNDDEKEYLLPRGSRFRVLSVERRKGQRALVTMETL